MKLILAYVLLFILVFIATFSMMPLLGFGDSPEPPDRVIQTPFQDFPGLIEV